MDYHDALKKIKEWSIFNQGYPCKKNIDHLYDILSKIKIRPKDLFLDIDSSTITMDFEIDGKEFTIETDGGNYLIGHLPFKSDPISAKDLNSAVELLSKIFKENNNQEE